MSLNQKSILEILEGVMLPGRWYQVKHLIELLESDFDDFSDWDLTPLDSEKNRPRWHRLVTNSVRLSPGRRDYPDNSWKRLRTRKKSRIFEYSLIPIDPIEERLQRESRDDDGSGFVYAIINPSWPSWVKIGMTIDLEKRMAAYQVYSPEKDYSILKSVFVEDRRVSEGIAHREASDNTEDERSGEWFRISDSVAESILDSL